MKKDRIIFLLDLTELQAKFKMKRSFRRFRKNWKNKKSLDLERTRERKETSTSKT